MFWEFKSLTWEKNAFIYSFRISRHIFFKSYSFSFLILPGFSSTSLPTKLQILSPSFSQNYGMLHKFGCHPCTWAMLNFSRHGFSFCFMCCWREQSIASFFSGKERCHWDQLPALPPGVQGLWKWGSLVSPGLQLASDPPAHHLPTLLNFPLVLETCEASRGLVLFWKVGS